MSAGVKVGLNVANLSLDPEDEFFTPDNRTGLVIGAMFSRSLRAQLDLQIEALYSQKGAKDEFSEDGFEFKETIKLDFVEIPVLANFTAARNDRMSVHVLAGPAFSFLVNDEQVTEINGEEESEDVGDVKSFDVGFAIGAAVRAGQVVFDARYTFGLVNLNDSPDEGEPSVKTRTFTFSVGWWFR